MTSLSENRRRFFRIDDRVRLNYRLRSPHEGLAAYHAGTVQQTAAVQLQQLDLELNGLLNTLYRDNPVAAQALGLLNRKVQILSEETEVQSRSRMVGDSLEVDVNISGCGLAFNTVEALGEKDVLELEITLLPSQATLHLLGRVSHCEPIFDSDHYRARLEFVGRDSDAHETLVQHLVQRQAAQIGSRKQQA